MRGLDTNVLVRFVTRDEPRHWQVAHTLVTNTEEQGERFHINVIVLCELVWVLAGSPYRFDRADVAALLDELLKSPTFEIQARDRVRRSLGLYRAGTADFADYMIGEENRQAGCTDTVTFDRQLRKAAGFTVLGR